MYFLIIENKQPDCVLCFHTFFMAILLISSPVPHLPSSLCVISFLPPSVLSPPQLLLSTDQPQIMSVPPAPPPPRPSSSPLPPQTQCRTSAHILPFVHFFVLREWGVDQSLGFISSDFSLILFILLSVHCLFSPFTCHC